MHAKNLYCWAISQYFPYSGFKWLNQREIDGFDVNPIEEDSPIRYILEVDLEYSDELYEFQNDFSLAPEKLEVSHYMLSIYCSSIANGYDINIGSVNKSVPNLGNKSKYVLHYRNIPLHFSFGIKLVSVHRVLKFKQSYLLKR